MIIRTSMSMSMTIAIKTEPNTPTSTRTNTRTVMDMNILTPTITARIPGTVIHTAKRISGHTTTNTPVTKKSLMITVTESLSAW